MRTDQSPQATSPSMPGPSRARKRTRSPSFATESLLTPWLDSMSSDHRNTDDFNRKLHYEIAAYERYMRPTRQENTIQEKVFSLVESVVKRRFNDGVVKLFGSAAFGLTLPTSDIDVVVSTSTLTRREEYKRPMFQLTSMLKNAGLTSYVDVRHRARTPILSFETTPQLGSYKVDIGLNNTDGLDAIPLVRSYMNDMPALTPLVLVVKGLLVQHSLNDAATGGLGSYAIILLVISFLQLNPTHCPQEDIDDPAARQSLGKLLIDLLRYYGAQFDYSQSYISVSQCKVLPKADASWINPQKPLSLAIQCLVKPDNDVGRPTHRLEEIFGVFKRASADLLSCSGEDESILGAIVGVGQSTIDRRARIVHLARAEHPVQPPRYPVNQSALRRPYPLQGNQDRPPPSGSRSLLERVGPPRNMGEVHGRPYRGYESYQSRNSQPPRANRQYAYEDHHRPQPSYQREEPKRRRY
ncbi:hypothetical protein ONZ45_g2350 [Pleurotus djamor]|nr:hypothetical protein ONZ45_g2350 [Pleurotus djamor]